MNKQNQHTPDCTGLVDDIKKLGQLLEESKKYYSLTPAQMLQGDLNKIIRKV